MSRDKIRQDYKALGLRVRECREKEGISQRVLANRAGISQAHVHRIESAQTRTSSAVIAQVARALELDEQWLISGEGVSGGSWSDPETPDVLRWFIDIHSLIQNEDTKSKFISYSDHLLREKLRAERHVLELGRQRTASCGSDRELGQRVKDSRESRKIGQRVLANRAGVSLAQIDDIENNQALPSRAVVAQLARALNRNEFWLHTGEGPCGLSWPSPDVPDLFTRFLDLYLFINDEETRERLVAYSRHLVGEKKQHEEQIVELQCKLDKLAENEGD